MHEDVRDPGAFTQVNGNLRGADAVGLANGRLHVAVATITNAGVLHAVRSPDGTWTSFARLADPPARFGIPTFADLAALGDEVHLVAVDLGRATVYHAVRSAGGSWTGFTDITPQTGSPGVFGGPVGAVGDSNGQVQITVSASPFSGRSQLLHSLRQANGQWTPFGDVESQTGNAGDPGSGKIGFSAE